MYLIILRPTGSELGSDELAVSPIVRVRPPPPPPPRPSTSTRERCTNRDVKRHQRHGPRETQRFLKKKQMETDIT